MSFVRVRTESDTRLDHIVKVDMFFDGSGKSLCGKSAWPGSWEDSKDRPVRVICVGCREKFRK